MASQWAAAGLVYLTAAGLAFAGSDPVPRQQGTAPQAGTAPIQGEAPHRAQHAKCAHPTLPGAAPMPAFHPIKRGTQLTCSGADFTNEGRKLGLESKAFYNGQREEYDKAVDQLDNTVPTQRGECMDIINSYYNARDRAYNSFRNRLKMEVGAFESRCGER